MKIKGKAIAAPPARTVRFPRENGEHIEFKLVPITSEKEFDRICPEPEATRVVKKGEEPYIDYNDPKYKERLEAHGQRRLDWMFIESIKTTEGIEFEKVKLDDPSTWHLLKEELEESGLSRAEVMYLLNKIAECNIVTDEYLKDAENRFFRKEASGT